MADGGMRSRSLGWVGTGRMGYRLVTRLLARPGVAEQRGTIPADYTTAREAAEAFYGHATHTMVRKADAAK